MIKRSVFFVLSASLLLTLSSLTGCKTTPKRNPAGVFGPGGFEGIGMGDEAFDPFDSEGGIGLSNRFTGGTEHPGMFDPVYFSYDGSLVSSSERTKIEAIADYLKQNPNVAVIVEGHCDERGSLEYNLALGERRALAIRSYLVSLSITEDRIQTKSYGEDKPVEPLHNDAAWSKNRRGEFVLYY